MKTFKEYITESVDKELDDLANELTTIFKKHFKNGYVKQSLAALGYDTRYITVGLIGNDAHVANKIRMNDPMHTVFSLHKRNNIISLELPNGASISINPPPNSYLAMGRHKIQFRKITGDAKKIAKGFDNFVAKMKQEVKKVEQNIHGKSNIPDMYFR
jgi:hypothetical protein